VEVWAEFKSGWGYKNFAWFLYTYLATLLSSSFSPSTFVACGTVKILAPSWIIDITAVIGAQQSTYVLIFFYFYFCFSFDISKQSRRIVIVISYELGGPHFRQMGRTCDGHEMID